MNRTKPAETKLVICVWHPFTEWRPKPAMAEAIRKRWPEMRVLHLQNYDCLPEELPDTDIFVGYSLRAEQLKNGKNLKWIHSTAAGAGAKFSGRGAAAGSRAMVAAGVVGQAPASDGTEWTGASHHRLRFDRA